MREKVVFIVGPTSSGKSAVALSLAEKIDGEIISCDSMQIYRDMEIISQAPDDDTLSRIKHHLARVIPPEEEYSVARFVEDAKETIVSIHSRKKTPIVVGGTGLYMKALADGIFDSPRKDEAFRDILNNIVVEKGTEYLYRELEKRDPVTAAKLHPNDSRRIIRALEVLEQTGRTIHEKKAEAKGIWDRYDCRIFGLDIPREILYVRINTAVDRMFEAGLVEEVKKLRERQLSLTAEKALGIKEVSAFLDGKASIEEAKEELKKNTRRYAKRQLTWFRADDRIKWIDGDRAPDDVAGEIMGRIAEKDRDRDCGTLQRG